MLNRFAACRMERAWVVAVAGLVILASGCEKEAKKAPPERVASVSSTTIKKQDIPEVVPGVGSLRAIEISTMAPEVAGNVIGRYFEDGQRVKKNDILYTLDRRTQEAQLDSTKVRLAEQQWVWERMKILAETQAASDAEVAETAYAIEALTAQVAEQQAEVDKLTIRAPYDGRVAIHMVDVGTYANVGDQLVKVVNDSVMLVDYELPTNWLPKLKVGQQVSLVTDADPSREYVGRVTAINPFVNATTRSVQVRAQVPNTDFSLRSGLYAEVSQVVGTFEGVLVVPQSSLVYSRNGAAIYAVKDGRAVPLPVIVKHKFDAYAIIAAAPPAKSSGSTKPPAHSSAGSAGQSKEGKAPPMPKVTLEAGVEIVVEGAAKIRPGMKVKTTPFHPADVSVITGESKPGSSSGD
ncbi:MAG: efflux RND transporter periplasmic adaptor subunit [Phycisphaerales bacterium]|nr:efflux RND transporter periplasmic adaptor subunit [Phycisphaerales bacterium]